MDAPTVGEDNTFQFKEPQNVPAGGFEFWATGVRIVWMQKKRQTERLFDLCWLCSMGWDQDVQLKGTKLLSVIKVLHVVRCPDKCV